MWGESCGRGWDERTKRTRRGVFARARRSPSYGKLVGAVDAVGEGRLVVVPNLLLGVHGLGRIDEEDDLLARTRLVLRER